MSIVVDTLDITEIDYNGWHIVFNSPIQYIVERVDDQYGNPWFSAYVEGFQRESAVANAESYDDLAQDYIPDELWYLLQWAPEDCYHHNDAEYEDYQLWYQYVKNTVDTMCVRAPNGMQFTGRDSDGSMKVEFKAGCLQRRK